MELVRLGARVLHLLQLILVILIQVDLQPQHITLATVHLRQEALAQVEIQLSLETRQLHIQQVQRLIQVKVQLQLLTHLGLQPLIQVEQQQ